MEKILELLKKENILSFGFSVCLVYLFDNLLIGYLFLLSLLCLFIFVEKTGSTSNKLGKTKLKTEDGSFWNCSFTLGMIAFYSVLFLALNKFYFKLPLPSFNLDEISIKKQISLVFGFVFFAMPFFSSFSKEWAILYHFKMTENVKWQKKMEKRSWFVRPKITPGITQGETFEVNLILLYFTNIIECVLHLLSFVLCKKTDN